MNLKSFIELLTSPAYLSILLLMFSTFIIGYFFGLRLTNFKNRKLIDRLKKEVNSLRASDKPLNEIETLFSEIKPKKIDIIDSAIKEKEKIKIPQPKQVVAEKTRSEYVNYSSEKPQLDFESFGYGDPLNSDRLTKINGIGPYIEEKLNEIGIYNFDQISRLQINDIRLITTLIDFFPGRIERDDWIGQAKALKSIHS
ncbi:MAG: hypothetical protein ACSHW7_06950 [Patiriisocius sp.]|uniref:hypothetical protein n=1 Tax=Patiriisocius sp. TaxID=2822396 RepID=UPI003EF36B45